PSGLVDRTRRGAASSTRRVALTPADWRTTTKAIELNRIREGSMRRPIGLVLLALVALGFVPAAAYAQTASIAGVVRDTSGAVLPGVTVEAASPALIEKVRTAITDGAGAYRVIDLRPGTYS